MVDIELKFVLASGIVKVRATVTNEEGVRWHRTIAVRPAEGKLLHDTFKQTVVEAMGADEKTLKAVWECLRPVMEK